MPCRVTQTFTTGDVDQRSLKVRVLQGTSEAAAENVELGCYELALLPAPGVCR